VRRARSGFENHLRKAIAGSGECALALGFTGVDWGNALIHEARTSCAGTADAAIPGMPIPAVSHYMQKPITIERTASLADAQRVMRQYQIRHLPVLDGGNLVGVVTQRDLFLLESVGEANVENSRVDEVMTEHPFIVTSDAALDEVLDIMADHKYGSVIVMGHAGVDGIFTAADACRVFAEMLRDQAGMSAEDHEASRPRPL
jgi:acetoin utilization protein AcuB